MLSAMTSMKTIGIAQFNILDNVRPEKEISVPNSKIIFSKHYS
jgi:hypothetical protein